MKRVSKGVLTAVLSILTTGLASASYYSGYSNFSPQGSILDIFDPGTVLYGGIFIILFGLLSFSLSKIFKNPDGRPSIVGSFVISFALSAMAVYGIYWSRWDPTLWISDGFFNGATSSIIPLIILAALIFLIWKFGFGTIIMIVGALLIGLTFTDMIYEKGALLLFGLGLLIVGFFIKNKTAAGVGLEMAKKKPMWALVILGVIGTIIGFMFSWIFGLAGILILILGWSGKKAGEKAAGAIKERMENKGRIFNKEKAETEAYEEKERREKAEEKAYKEKRKRERKAIRKTIAQIDTAISQRKELLNKTDDKKIGKDIKKEIRELEKQKRALIDQIS